MRCIPRSAALALRAIVLLALVASGTALHGAEPKPGATRVVVISDLNESYGSVRYSPAVERAVARTVALKPQLVISAGDMVAGQRLAPLLGRDDLEAMWKAFHAHVSDPIAAAGLPLAVTPGNHDASGGPRFALEREIYREQWTARRPGVEFIDAERYPFQYAFRVGEVLFISLDATEVGHLPPPARAWLRGMLERHGPQFRHRVVFSHLPIWPFAVGRETEILGDHELEEILQKGRVDVHLSGHHHAYYPGYRHGVRFVSQGCLGAAPRPLIGTVDRPARSITVIDFDADGAIRIDAFRGPDFTTPIERRTLPERIESRWVTLVRDDLAPAAAGTPAQ